MNFLPIALRELRARARHWTTYRNRFLAALITVLIAAFMLVITGAFGTPSIVGGTLFKTLSTIAFLFCLLEGLRHTVDCLSEEKREGTLGLIFLTELNGLDVILGKLIVNSLHSFYGLLAIFPALAIPFVLGGVVVGEFWRMMLALLNALFFALAIGLFVSSLGRDERRVWGTAIALVALVVVGLPLMDLALAAGNPSRFQPLFSLASPWCAWWCAYDSIFTAHPGTYWSSFFIMHLLNWLLLVLAGGCLAATWHDQGNAPRVTWLEKICSAGMLPPDASQRGCRQMLESNPVCWLMDRYDQPRRLIWILTGLAVASANFIVILGKGDSIYAWTALGILWCYHWCLKIWIAVLAVNSYASANRSGMVELLAVTPLSPWKIVDGNFQALRRCFLLPTTVLAMLEGVSLLGVILFTHQSSHFIIGSVLVLFGLITLFADLIALSWVGMWFGLNSRKSGTALAKTLGYVLGIPFIASPAAFSLCGIGWPGFVAIKDLFFINWAHRKLLEGFRNVASREFVPDQEPPRWWPWGRSKIAQNPPPLPPPIIPT